ncbi:hypothetical protein H6761_00195 [Candidatus Nomurabacteria bacterium]|nr:hypothetical protein [Candidatus Nomurabacteria bacterium]
MSFENPQTIEDQKEEINIEELLKKYNLKLASEPRPTVLPVDGPTPKFSRQRTMDGALNALANAYQKVTDHPSKKRWHWGEKIEDAKEQPTIFQELQRFLVGKKIIFVEKPDPEILRQAEEETGEVAIFTWPGQSLLELSEQIDHLILKEEQRVTVEEGAAEKHRGVTWDFQGEPIMYSSFWQEKQVMKARGLDLLSGTIESRFDNQGDVEKMPTYADTL